MATIVVVGSGAREHAILAALARSKSKPTLLCFGSANNPGISALCTATTVGKLTDGQAIVDFAKQLNATLAVIGPEAPLASGVADLLRANELRRQRLRRAAHLGGERGGHSHDYAPLPLTEFNKLGAEQKSRLKAMSAPLHWHAKVVLSALRQSQQPRALLYIRPSPVADTHSVR